MPEQIISDEFRDRHVQSFLSLVQSQHHVLAVLVWSDAEVMYASMRKQSIHLPGIGWAIPDLYTGRDAAWRLHLAASAEQLPDTARIFYEMYVDFLEMLQEVRPCR